jgi:predicted Zn-dependent protease with MMP-like domain
LHTVKSTRVVASPTSLRHQLSPGELLTVPTKPAACPTSRGLSGGKVVLMADTTNPESFEEIVEWAYSTLPQKIRDLPDFPGIQVVDEPPADVLEDISNRKKWRRGTELLGLYSGTFRTKRSYTQLKYAPDLIFVFRGPILRCSKGDLRAAVKRVVWHEVAHWLGYETEEQVKDLGL